MIKFLLPLTLFLVVEFSYSQISDITKLPVQSSSQVINESECLWLSENEIIIFYVNETMDTIYSSKSLDRGMTWQEPMVVAVVELSETQDYIYLTALKSNTNRILLAWSVLGYLGHMELIYSDDDGENWSQPIEILGGGSPTSMHNSIYLKLTKWDSGEICLTFFTRNFLPTYYRLSVDEGLNWGSSNAYEFPTVPPFHVIELSIFSVGQDSLLGIYELSGTASEHKICSRLSPDKGISWEPQKEITDGSFEESKPEVEKMSDGTIVLAYTRNTFSSTSEYSNSDISYQKSSDNGNTWSGENRLTRYIGNDTGVRLSSFGAETFFTFLTERFSANIIGANTYQIAFGILEETTEQFTPPKVINISAPHELIDFENEEFVLNALVIDDEAVGSVSVVIEDSVYAYELFDDGLHNDGEANDSVFGNTLPIIKNTDRKNYNLDVNNIELPFNNKGVLADVYVVYKPNITISAKDDEGYESISMGNVNLGGPGSLGKFDDIGFLFSAGFYLSGYSNGVMFTNGVATASLINDYLPGKVGSDPEDSKNIIYSVNKDDTPFGYSWQTWKDAVSLGAEFYDGDGDGIYNPVDKNWNGTWDINEDMPPLIGDEIAWCVYNDALPREYRRWNTVEPQGIEVRQTIFASDNPGLENMIFIKYSILNTGEVTDVMDSVYFGVWEDPDLGEANDDLVGCDTLLQSGFVYNSQDDPLYGTNPPSFFTTLLQGPITDSSNPNDSAKQNYGELIGNLSFSGSKNLEMTCHTFNRGGDPVLNDPNSAEDARCYLRGRTRQCDLVNPCTFAYCQVRGGVDCSEVNPLFWASGDPVTDYGWILTSPVDHRNLISTGSFKLEKDKPQEIIIAYVLGRGTDPLNSITVARGNVQRAIEEYESNFASMTYSPPPATNPVDNYVLYQNYPNPFNPTTTIRYELPQDGVVTINIYNILGQRVKTLLNEFKRADRYEITFNGTGLASGVYFYTLKVNNFIKTKKMIYLK